MSKITRQDSDGVKPLLSTGELGYDNYPAGGDVGRVYVGTGSANIAQAKKSEVDSAVSTTNAHIGSVNNPHAVTKAQVGLSNADNTSDNVKNVLSATKWTAARTITLSGDVSGSVSVDGSANVTMSTTIQPNSVALGTDTTGNYMVGVIAGSGLSVSHTQGEGSTATITNSAPNVTTNITTTHTSTNVVVNSSDGTDGTINSATQTLAGAMSAIDKTKLDGIEEGATADQTAAEIKTAYESNNNTNALTDSLLTLLTTKKVKNVSTDAVNNKLVITYTDNTVSNLNINDIITDIRVSGATLDATTNVLTLISTDGGADVTVDLSDFVNSSELTTALNTTVNLTGNQTIVGVKTFSSNIVGSITGNSGTATKLATARTIGGVSFDGTTNISLPGVNAAGNQTTTGNAGSATKLAIARTINGVAFDGSADITVPTNLDITAGTTAGPIVTSSSGTNATLPTASATASGVMTTGAQTFAGAKTFNSSPIVPTPTTDTQATNKQYVDSKYSGVKNYIINGNMVVAQRGDGPFITNSAYTIDQWFSYTSSTGSNITRLWSYASGLYAQVRVGSGTDTITLEQRLDDLHRFYGKTLTLSYRLFKGNYTGNTIPYSIALAHAGGRTILYTGTHTFDNINRKKFTFTIPDLSAYTLNANSYLEIRPVEVINLSHTGEFGITDIQLEEGSVATPFENRPYGLELSLCQRYFYNHGAKEGRNPPYDHEETGATGVSTSGTIAYRLSQDHPSPMRATPTVSYSGTIFLWNGPTEINVISIALNNSNATTRSIDYNIASVFSGTFHPVKEFLTQGSFLNVSAEL